MRKPDQTKYMDMKTIQPSAIQSSLSTFQSSILPKIDKRVDIDENLDGDFDYIQPSEVGHPPCTTSCSCSHSQTEHIDNLKTKFAHNNDGTISLKRNPLKTSKYGATKLEHLRPTHKAQLDKKTQYGPYEYESNTKLAPTDKIVEKYTEVISDYSDEKYTSSVEASELLTNEQAPSKINKLTNNKTPEKSKPDKPIKPNKNKFVGDLLKLGSLGIKGLSQLAPVIEKMTGGFMKRQDVNKTTTSTTMKPLKELTPYNANKRVDIEIDPKNSNFPIYIPVDELEASESQIMLTNVTLHQNLAWAAERKHPKSHNIMMPPRIIHESPLVNGGIPISPGDVITAHSDVIVGKPAVGGPLTLAVSGIKLHNDGALPQLDSFVSGSEQFMVHEKPPGVKPPNFTTATVDDSYDLRPPDLPKKINKLPSRNLPRPTMVPPTSHIITPFMQHNNMGPNKMSLRPIPLHISSDNLMKTEQIKTPNILGNHGRPAFLDYIPSLAKPVNEHNIDISQNNKQYENEFDSSPSPSEIINTKDVGEYSLFGHASNPMSKPFLVDIQPSRVANVLIPHGSSTALVFAGSSEPHKTGDYVDDPLPYPEPGYFGSFSIDAPQMTNVHNVPPSNKQFQSKPHTSENFKTNTHKHKGQVSQINDYKINKWKDNRRPIDFDKIPAPTSNQETHLQVGPHITAYNPDVYNPSNGDFDRYNLGKGSHKSGKDVIDKDYENYLSVPPPPPKMHHNSENGFDKHRPYNQRPIVHTKPIQDMKIFLNIQHPVTKQPSVENQNSLPPKVTSEVYFAVQAPGNTKQTPVYTVHLPNSHSKPLAPNNGINKDLSYQNSLSVNNYENNNKHISTNNNVDKNNNMYTVTLNTATNVANGFAESGQIVGSSIPVSIGTSNTNNALNTDIPIESNFAIKVDENSIPFNSFNMYGRPNTHILNNDHDSVSQSIPTWDNKWNISSNTNIPERHTLETNKYHEINAYEENNQESNEHKDTSINIPLRNSHGNFPMINEHVTITSLDSRIKPVTENVDENVKVDQKRPPKLIPNIPTNSHGWHSSAPIQEFNSYINNIKVEATTRKIIPLSHDYSNDNIPDFGQKISTVGKPPTEFWAHDHIEGKPFIKPKTERPYGFVNTAQLTTKPYGTNYIPSNIGNIKQPVYDIPIRDNSNENVNNTTKPNIGIIPVYENSEEIYDGGDDNESNSDEEVSLESMRVPVVSTSHTKQSNTKTTEMTLLQDEVFESTLQEGNNNSTNGLHFVDFNPGTQTEKPFAPEKYNRSTIFTSNTIKPIIENDNSNKYYNMKPRPFTVNTITTLDHQLHQPHWQINQLWENTTNLSSDENIDLNTGEKINKASTTTAPKRIEHNVSNILASKYKPPRPVFSVRPSNSVTFNDSNIITSTVHIKDKKPLVVLEGIEENVSTLPTFTFTSSNFDLNRSSSEIIDLSPPPPTLDYDFKPSTNDETIMGMSPPPPRTPVMPPVRSPLPNRGTATPRPILPTRTPSPYRTKPPRTLPPRVTRPTRKPIKDHRDNISTYRPNYDILLHNNMRRPGFNKGQPSSQLVPPPRDLPSEIITPINEIIPSSIVNVPSVPNIIFPTPTSSGWLTSSGIGFSSNFDFAPSSVQFPEKPLASNKPQFTEKTNSAETETSSEYVPSVSTNDDNFNENGTSLMPEAAYTTTKLMTYETTTKSTDEERDSVSIEQSQEDRTTERIKVVPLRNKDRTRKPYPVRESDKPINNRYKPPTKSSSSIIKPTRTLSRPEYVLPTRQTTIRKIHPIPTIAPNLHRPSIIESSESSVDDEYIKPTEILKENEIPTISSSKQSIINEISSKSSIIQSVSESLPTVIPTHHAGNEVKVYDEIIPTKTEFKTTVITLTKTLSEPAKTISSVGYMNLTHTLTVTHTKTSLISQSGGAITQTLILTNTHTSTIVDVVTEIYTQVQPTTIIETVTKHIPVQVEPTSVRDTQTKTKIALDDIAISSEEENLIIRDNETTENIQKIDKEEDNDTFFVVMNKSQSGGNIQPVNTDIETPDYDGITRNEQVNTNGVSQVLFGEILLAGTPYLETTNIVNPTTGFGKECQPDCKASRNERCQRIDGMMKCICRPGFARMFPDRPCKPTYTYSVKLALTAKGKENLQFNEKLSDNSSKEYSTLALATHEGINRMIMQSDLRDVYHGVHITGFQPVKMKRESGEVYQGVMNDFYVQLSDNAHESRLKEVIEKYLRNNNYSLGGTDIFASGELVDKLDVSDFDECVSGSFHDCSEHAQCFNLRGTYTCSCLEGFADLSVNSLYPGRICSAEPVGCEMCNYHGACYSRDDRRVLCECFQWYAGSTCHINLKVVLISLVTSGALLTIVLVVCAVVACSKRPRPPQRSIVACIQGMPGLHQGAMPSKQRTDRRALISERADSGEASSIQNASLPYMPSKKSSTSGVLKKCVISEPPAHDPPPPPAPAVMIPRARLYPPHRDSRDNASRKQSLELSGEAKLISYLESGAVASNDEMMRRKYSMESSYSANKDRHNKQGALVSAGFKVSTTVKAEEAAMKEESDDLSSINKGDLEAELAHFDSLRKSYSHEELSEWTDAEHRIGELTLSEARSVGGTLPASTGRAASSTRLTHQEANTMAERDLGSTFLLPHVHLYKPDITSDVSEFDSL